jgi:exodeoxyribonuclease III
MKIVTFNVNGIRARLPRLLEYLNEQQPDVVCLQELKCGNETLPVADLRAAGYEGLWHGQKGFNGVALLGRGNAIPVLRKQGLDSDSPDSQSRYVEGAVGNLVVASLYLPNGNPVGTEKFSYKLAWAERLLTRARELRAENRPVVLAGDWNIIPTEHPDDVFSARAMAPDALMQPESRAAYRRFLDAGWVDALRTLHPTGPLYTFWDYMAGSWRRNAGFRIDHLLLSPLAADLLVGAGVDREYRGREKASDHAPTWVELRT